MKNNTSITENLGFGSHLGFSGLIWKLKLVNKVILRHSFSRDILCFYSILAGLWMCQDRIMIRFLGQDLEHLRGKLVCGQFMEQELPQGMCIGRSVKLLECYSCCKIRLNCKSWKEMTRELSCDRGQVKQFLSQADKLQVSPGMSPCRQNSGSLTSSEHHHWNSKEKGRHVYVYK